jgi:hypothetical protein
MHGVYKIIITQTEENSNNLSQMKQPSKEKEKLALYLL